jgi:putative transposase
VGAEILVKTILELQSIFSIQELCSLLSIPRSTFYRWKKRNWQQKDEIELAVIQLCKDHKFRYGYRRVTAAIRKMFQ